MAAAYVSARTSGLDVRLAESRSKFPRAKQLRRHVRWCRAGRPPPKLVSCVSQVLVSASIKSPFDCGGSSWASSCSHIPGPSEQSVAGSWGAQTRDRRVASQSVSSVVSVCRHPLPQAGHWRLYSILSDGPGGKSSRYAQQKTAAGAHHGMNCRSRRWMRDGRRLKSISSRRFNLL